MNFPRTLSPSNALVLPPADHHDHDGDDDGDDDDDDDDGDGDYDLDCDNFSYFFGTSPLSVQAIFGTGSPKITWSHS